MTGMTIFIAIIMAVVTALGLLPGQIAIFTGALFLLFNGLRASNYIKAYKDENNESVSSYEVSEQVEIAISLTATGVFSMILVGSGFYGLEFYDFYMSTPLYLFTALCLVVFFEYHQKCNVLFSKKKVLHKEFEKKQDLKYNEERKRATVMPIETVSKELKEFSDLLEGAKNSFSLETREQNDSIEKLSEEIAELKNQINKLDIENNPRIKISKN